MNKVICNKAKNCKMREGCGGVIPHDLCSECGNCPWAKRINAKCIEIKLKMEFIATSG